MKLLEKSLNICMVLTLATLVWTVAYADTWDEAANGGGDAGDFPAGTFQMSDGSATFDRITGDMGDFFGGDTGYDAYLITVTDDTTFYVEDSFGNDTKAFGYDMGGNPLFACDDNAGPGATGFSLGFGNQNTHLGNVIGSPAPLNTGDQFVLVVGSFGDTAAGDGGGTVFLDDGGDFSALVGPTGENFASWNAGGGNGAYDIALTGCELGGEPVKKGCDFDLGDVNMDGSVDILDVAPFVAAITGDYVCEADVNEDGVVDILDVSPFVALITGG